MIKPNHQFLHIPTEADTFVIGQKLAAHFKEGGIIFLRGQLGAGKTTLTRAIMRGLNYQDKVKSPSYSIVETYELPSVTVCHIDLYRIQAAEELAYLGLETCFLPQVLALIEWPEKGEGHLPPADLTCYIEIIDTGRQIRLEPHTLKGQAMVRQL